MPNADIFISYRRDQRDQVVVIAEKLQQLGLAVWFDARLEAGTSFDEEINREVRTAKAVMVCWSPEAIQSRWVRAEASIGLERDVLVAVFLHPTELVPPYNLVHAASLEGWAGDHDAPAWREVLGRIGKLVGRPHLVDEAVAKSMDGEWAERDGQERAAFKTKLEEARRRFAANHEAQPAIFNQALADMATAFESWVLRRRIAALGPAPDPLSLVADHSENLRIDLATAQRERDAAATFASRGRAGGAQRPGVVVAPQASRLNGGVQFLAVLFGGPIALLWLNRRIIATIAAVLWLVPFGGYFLGNIVGAAAILGVMARRRLRHSLSWSVVAANAAALVVLTMASAAEIRNIGNYWENPGIGFFPELEPYFSDRFGVAATMHGVFALLFGFAALLLARIGRQGWRLWTSVIAVIAAILTFAIVSLAVGFLTDSLFQAGFFWGRSWGSWFGVATAFFAALNVGAWMQRLASKRARTANV